MLIAGLVASLLITPGAVLTAAGVPAMVVSVTASSDLAPTVVAAVLEEAGALWQAAGVHFIWQRHDRAVGASMSVVIGGGAGRPTDASVALGWILFDDDMTPQPKIYLSYTNALVLLTNSRAVTGNIDAMPRAQRETLLSRAMGRALAHELGHFLLASKRHAETGLMRGVHTSPELFGPDREPFKLALEQRDQLALRFARHTQVASR